MSFAACTDHSDDNGDYVVVYDNYSRNSGRRTCPVCELISQKEELQSKLNKTEVALGTISGDNEELRARIRELEDQVERVS